MSEELFFVADAALIDRLGRELVGKQETALVELIKNSFDADATNVKVTFGLNTIEVADNGSGMNREELVNGFLRLASNLKVSEPRSRRFRRSRAGRKGIGRFATQRLGRTLVLRTCTEHSAAGLELRVDWAKFVPEVNLEEVPVIVSEIEASSHGTTLIIGGLRDYGLTLRSSAVGVVWLASCSPFQCERFRPSRCKIRGFRYSLCAGAALLPMMRL